MLLSSRTQRILRVALPVLALVSLAPTGFALFVQVAFTTGAFAPASAFELLVTLLLCAALVAPWFVPYGAIYRWPLWGLGGPGALIVVAYALFAAQ